MKVAELLWPNRWHHTTGHSVYSPLWSHEHSKPLGGQWCSLICGDRTCWLQLRNHNKYEMINKHIFYTPESRLYYIIGRFVCPSFKTWQLQWCWLWCRYCTWRVMWPNVRVFWRSDNYFKKRAPCLLTETILQYNHPNNFKWFFHSVCILILITSRKLSNSVSHVIEPAR